TVPAGLTGIAASGTSLFTCSVAGQTVTCTGGAVNQGSNATITINATAPAVTGSITNTAAVDPDNAIAEGNELNNTSSLVNTSVVTSLPQPLLTVNLTDSPAEIAGAGHDPSTPGSPLVFKALATNASSLRADDVNVVIGTQGLEASSIQVSQLVTDGTVGNFGGCFVEAPQVRCVVRTLNSGGTILVTVTGQVVASAGSTLITTATVSGNIKNTGYGSTDTEMTTIKPGIDLTITKADAPDPVCARSWPGAAPLPLVCRGGLTYTFVVGNSGIYEATGVTIRDPLIPGAILDSFNAPAFSGGCSVDGANVLTCTGGTVGPESTTVVTVVLTVPDMIGSWPKTVTVDPNNAIFEADETNNMASATTQVVTGVDLTVGKTDAIDPIATSGTETYTILVNNLGTQDVANVRVRDTLPAGTIFRDVISDHGFTCSHAAGVVECVGGAIKGTASNNYPPLGGNLANPPDTATITIRIFAQSFAGTMHNEVRVDPLGEIAEANEANNIEIEDTVVDSFTSGHGAFNQLTITKTQTDPDETNTARNAKVTYSIVVGNNGSDPAVGITVRDYIPAGATFIEASGTNEFNCSQVGGYVDCLGGTIPSLGNATITLYMFAPDTPGTYVNQAVVDPDNTIPEGSELDNQAFETTTVVNGGAGAFNELRIEKTATAPIMPAPPLLPTTYPLGPITYTLKVWNEGEESALNVSVRDVLPAGVTFVSATDSGGPGAAFVCSHAAGVVTCSGATLLAGIANARYIEISATAPDEVVASIHNVADVDPGNAIPEGDEFNNSAFADVKVASRINLTAKKTGPTVATQSSVTDYTIKVKNNKIGDGAIATGVVMRDNLPPGLIPLAVEAGTGNNWTCAILENPINVAQCIGDLNPDEEVTIKITVFITAESGRSLDNVACVDPDDTITESEELDNCSDFGTLVTPEPLLSPDLLVSKTVDAASTTPGADLTWTITISNVGTAKAKGWDPVSMTGLTLTDSLPTGEVTFTNATPTNGWTCTESGGTITCHDNGTGMEVGAFAQVTVLAHVKDTAAIPIVNTAAAAQAVADCASGCENEIIENMENNVSTVVSSIGSSGFDLAIATVTDNPDPVAPGQGLRYTIVGVNGGTSEASNVHISVALPTAGVVFANAEGSNGFNCGAPSGTTIDCVGNLPGGGNTTITVNLTTLVAAPMPPDLTLTATIDPADTFPETNEGNNTKTQVTTVSAGGTCSACVDLVASQLKITPEIAVSGGSLTVTFQVVNIGDSPTALNPLSDRLLSLLVLSDGTVSAAAATSSSASVTCSVGASGANFMRNDCKGNLAPSEGVTITVTTTVTGTGAFVFGTADPDDLIPLEFNESNNSANQSVVLF
ncbi:MAG TPA: CARDB domain-containing protein, partial [Thermoanaerobaculia bacterium]